MKEQQGKYAWMAKVGEKGQIVIPKEARDLFKISPGDTVLILGDIEKGLAIPTRKETEEFITRVFSAGAK